LDGYRGLDKPMEVTIRAICNDLPRAGGQREDDAAPCSRTFLLGIQRGESIIELKPLDDNSIVFEAVFRVAERDGGRTNFLGPYAKGTVTERFFYLSWVEVGQSGEHTRYGRAKIQLSHLPWSVVASAADAGTPLTVLLSLTDKRGRPRCGSIRDGEARWRL
jgi:hypothetical protein